MKNPVVRFSLFTFFLAMLAGCEPGFYEQKLNSKIDDHLKVIRKLNAEIVEAESEIQRHGKFAPKLASNFVPQDTTQIGNKSDFLLLQKRCEVGLRWFEAHSAENNQSLLAAIDSDKQIKFKNESCIRISCEDFQLSELFSTSNQRRFIKPSPEPSGNEPHPVSSGPFGNRLDRFFHPRSFEVIPVGISNQISVANDPDQSVVQLQISCQSFTNPARIRIPIRDRQNTPSTNLFVSVVPPLKSPTERKFSVRLSPRVWSLGAAIPLADDPERISLHFLKVIEVN